ncbi:MAG: hypothetical protein U0T83_04900 [Bacteriovoracaceae bacterium]
MKYLSTSIFLFLITLGNLFANKECSLLIDTKIAGYYNEVDLIKEFTTKGYDVEITDAWFMRSTYKASLRLTQLEDRVNLNLKNYQAKKNTDINLKYLKNSVKMLALIPKCELAQILLNGVKSSVTCEFNEDISNGKLICINKHYSFLSSAKSQTIKFSKLVGKNICDQQDKGFYAESISIDFASDADYCSEYMGIPVGCPGKTGATLSFSCI